MSLKNFTIILPGSCNAHCDFCDDRGDPHYQEDYLEQLKAAIDSLPDSFVQVSITGGEPTMSPVLKEVLSIVANSHRFDKVVLTTNGFKLEENLTDICQVVDHLNISRHAISDAENAEIFGTPHIIHSEALSSVCAYANRMGVDVNTNCVYTATSKHITRLWVDAFIDRYSSLGVNKFTFRYDQRDNNLDPTFLEKQFTDLEVVESGGCPVCRSHSYFYKGRYLTFKAAFDEPSLALKGSEGIYELIFHEDGTLSEDWRKLMPMKKKSKVPTKAPRLYTEEEVRRIVKREVRKSASEKVRYVPVTSGGCGTGGCGG